MATRRNVRTDRTVYTRRPGPAPRKRGDWKPSGVMIKRAIQALIIMGGLFGFWQVFSVSSIAVTGNRVIPTNDIIMSAETSFNRHPLSRNLLTVGTGSLVRDLLSDRRIGVATIKRSWPNKLTIEVTERQISLVWKTGSNLYLLDSNGVAVAALAVAPKLPIVIDSASLPVQVGQSVVPQQFVAFANQLAGEMAPKTGLGVANMTVPDTTSELYVQTSAKYTIKFDTTSGVEDQLNSLKTVLATLAKLHKAPSQYIDLRVPNKAYYL